MLWFDCTSSFHYPELRLSAAEYFEVACTSRLEGAAQDIERLRPRVLCFDFDYPDQARLRLMQAVKRQFMSLPLLMLTVEHSEALAVWAFRSRVWNYLVKPVSTAEIQENLRTLAQIATTERRFGRAVARPEEEIPNEVPSSRPDESEAALLPAIYYIEQHFSERCSADEVAKLCGMSRFRFSRLFRCVFGLTFRDYLMRYRIGEACRLLQRPSVSITEVGGAVGFNDLSRFARTFKRYTGALPSDYMADPQSAASNAHSELTLCGPEVSAKLRARRAQFASLAREPLLDKTA